MTFIVNTGGRLVELPLKKAIKRVKDGDAVFYVGPHPTDPTLPDIEEPKLPVVRHKLTAKMEAIRNRRLGELESQKANLDKKGRDALEKAQKANASSAKAASKKEDEEAKLLTADPNKLDREQCIEILAKFGSPHGANEADSVLQKRVAALQKELTA